MMSLPSWLDVNFIFACVSLVMILSSFRDGKIHMLGRPHPILRRDSPWQFWATMGFWLFLMGFALLLWTKTLGEVQEDPAPHQIQVNAITGQND